MLCFNLTLQKKVLLMKDQKDYKQDIADIRSMMERSSKFLSLSGWAGIMAGVYALLGAYLAYWFYEFNPDQLDYRSSNLQEVIFLALVILILALGTAIALSYRKGKRKGEKLWNPTSRRLLLHMSLPLLVGGVLLIILISKGLTGLVAPLSMIFYGLAIFNASKFTFEDIKILGLVQISLGLVGVYVVELGILLWALGFGVAHVIYGIYMHYRYER